MRGYLKGADLQTNHQDTNQSSNKAHTNQITHSPCFTLLENSIMPNHTAITRKFMMINCYFHSDQHSSVTFFGGCIRQENSNHLKA